jgi:hypothetical protein
MDIRDPDYRTRRINWRWYREQEEAEGAWSQWFAKRRSDESQRYWAKAREPWDEEAERWLRGEIPACKPETISMDDLYDKLKASAGTKKWDRYKQWVSRIPQWKFAADTYKYSNTDDYGCDTTRMKWSVHEYVQQWTDGRQARLAEMLQGMEDMRTVCGSKKAWGSIFGDPIFTEADKALVLGKIREIRAVCMDQEMVDTIAIKVWNYAVAVDVPEVLLMYEVQEFLDPYGDCGTLVLESLKHQALDMVQGVRDVKERKR